MIKKFFDENHNPIWNDHVKPAMCGDHFLGNLFAWAWMTTDCSCCAFFRGMVIGAWIVGALWLIS